MCVFAFDVPYAEGSILGLLLVKSLAKKDKNRICGSHPDLCNLTKELNPLQFLEAEDSKIFSLYKAIYYTGIYLHISSD